MQLLFDKFVCLISNLNDIINQQKEVIMTNDSVEEAKCCPEFDPIPWEDKIIEWDHKKFVKTSVFTFLFMPLNFGGVMTKLMKKFDEVGAVMENYICLSEHTSKWNMNIYMETDRIIPSMENIELTGKYFSKVYEGPFKNTREWCKDYEEVVAAKGLKITKWYMWYTVCPKCAKKYGKNHVVIIGEIA